MGFETELVLYCDNGCGAREDYEDIELGGGAVENLLKMQHLELPEGWVRGYDNGDSIFGILCGDCVLDFEEGGGH